MCCPVFYIGNASGCKRGYFWKTYRNVKLKSTSVNFSFKNFDFVEVPGCVIHEQIILGGKRPNLH